MSLIQVWQSSEEALLQMVVVVSVRLVAGENTLPGWDHLGTAAQLLLVTELVTPRCTDKYDVGHMRPC